jgi:uncharacterized protein (TIGR03663 family)
MEQSIRQATLPFPATRSAAAPASTDRLYLAWWAGIWLVSALLRLYDLGSALLSPAEINEAMAALSGIVGSGAGGAASSGLLVSFNRILFWLLGPSDVSARLLPAAVGCMLPLTAWLFSGHLGRTGALIAAGFLAISPSMVFFSRTASGTILGVAAALFLLGSLLRYWDGGNRRWLLAAGAALGLGISSGATFLSIMLVVVPATAIARPAGLGRLWRGLASRRPLLVAAAALVLGSTAFAFFPAGLGVTADGLAAWLSGFELNRDALSRPFGLLLIYELFVVVFGLCGAVWARRRGNRFSAVLVFWLILGLVLGALRPGQPDVVFVSLIPLVMLASLFLDSILSDVFSSRAGRPVLLGSATATVILGVHLFVSLGQYARHAASNPDRADASLLLVGVSAVLMAGVVALIWTFSRRLAIGSFVLGLAVLLSVYGWGRAWELGRTHQADPRELWVNEATAPGMGILVETLKTTSDRATGASYALPLTVQTSLADPLLRWYLRDFESVTWVDSLQPGTISEAVLTLVEEENPILGDSYLGMDLVLQLGAPAGTDTPPAGAPLRWLLLRDASSAGSPTTACQVVLWVRQDVALAGG